MAEEPGPKLNIKGIDDLLKHLGNPGRFQTLTFVLLALNYFPVVFHHVCMAFYGYIPPHDCRPQRPLFPKDVISASSARPSYRDDVNMTTVTGDGAGVIFRSCDVVLPAVGGGKNRTELCRAGEFHYSIPEEEKTMVMEWDLVCDDAYFAHLATTVYYCGVMLGGFVCGYISDVLGRRPVILLAVLGATGLGTGLAFVREFWTFLGLRFVLGFLTQGLHTASYVMAIELFPMQHRTMAGCLIQLAWGGAVLALGGVAWLLKDWRLIQLAISLPSVLAVSYFWLVPESLRWLLIKEKWTEAERLIKRIATFNRSASPLRHHPQVAVQALSRLRQARAAGEQKARQGSVKDLFSTSVMLKRSVILFYIWFSGNVSYFGLTFMSTSLSGNRFLNYTLSAAVEFFAYVINIFIVRRFGRRRPLCVLFCGAALSCLAVGFVSPYASDGGVAQKVTIAFSVMGKFCAGGSFTIFELLTAEMYPTVLRNVGAGLCGFWGRLGAVVAPQCLSLSLYTFRQLPAMIIGGLTLAGGGLTLLLPDTSHTHLPDTVYEATVDADSQERVKASALEMTLVRDPLLAVDSVSAV